MRCAESPHKGSTLQSHSRMVVTSRLTGEDWDRGQDREECCADFSFCTRRACGRAVCSAPPWREVRAVSCMRVNPRAMLAAEQSEAAGMAELQVQESNK